MTTLQNYKRTNKTFSFLALTLLNPASDQHIISPYINIAESFMKITRIKDEIANLRSLDFRANSPCQYQKKFMKESIENMDTHILGYKRLHTHII